MSRLMIAAVLFGFLVAGSEASTKGNPIRKVVTLMQNMQKEIQAENAKEQELFDKFMCFCNGGVGDLNRAIDDAKSKIQELTAKGKSEAAEKVQTEQERKEHKKDLENAKHDLEEAANIRAKESEDNAAVAADSKANIGAMSNAIPALEKGMGAASFLQQQSNGADRIRKLLQTLSSVDANDRRQVLAFLDQSQDYAPQSGQIVGILKAMKDEMESTLKETESTEAQAAAAFADLKSSKETEAKLASQGIESKTARAGELAVMVVQTKDALEDTEVEQADAEKFVASLQAQCGTKQEEWAHTQKMRNEEIAAISEAIEILNDDDALETFKKAIPSDSLAQESVGFLQRQDSRASRVKKAQAILANAVHAHPNPSLKLLLYTLSSKIKSKARNTEKQFDEVLKMLDNMVDLLTKEQAEDFKQKDWCREEFDTASDERKAADRRRVGIEADLGDMGDRLLQVTEDIKNLKAGIVDLDKDVAVATEQRKQEHEDYTAALGMNNIAESLVEKAKNRMNKFYNPSEYKAPPTTTTLSPIDSPYGFVQLRSVVRRSRVAPPEAPEAPAAYEKKSGKSAGVVGLMTQIIHDLSMDSAELQRDEKKAQADYVQLMEAAQQTRAADSKAITNNKVMKGQLEGKFNLQKESHRAVLNDLTLNAKYTNDLHISCDFINQNFDMRNEARTNEIDSLKSAKAVLSGAGP